VEMVDTLPDDDPEPVAPVAPTARDCCRGGCEPCVFEIYEEEVARYEAALREWKLRQRVIPAEAGIQTKRARD